MVKRESTYGKPDATIGSSDRSYFEGELCMAIKGAEFGVSLMQEEVDEKDKIIRMIQNANKMFESTHQVNRTTIERFTQTIESQVKEIEELKRWKEEMTAVWAGVDAFARLHTGLGESVSAKALDMMKESIEKAREIERLKRQVENLTDVSITQNQTAMKIYITDQGQIRGEHPDYPFPPPGCMRDALDYMRDALYHEHIKLAKDHSIEFEDQERVLKLVKISLVDKTDDWPIKPHPGIYTVDLPEVEMVEQFKAYNNGWKDRADYKHIPLMSDERTVFCFVEREEDQKKALIDMMKQDEESGMYEGKGEPEGSYAGEGMADQTFSDYIQGLSGVTHTPKQDREEVNPLLDLVNDQANDPTIWFRAQTINEAHLQHQIRCLHTLIELISPSQLTSEPKESQAELWGEVLNGSGFNIDELPVVMEQYTIQRKTKE